MFWRWETTLEWLSGVSIIVAVGVAMGGVFDWGVVGSIETVAYLHIQKGLLNLTFRKPVLSPSWYFL